MSERREQGMGSITPRGPGRFLIRWPDHGKRPGKIIHGTHEDARSQLAANLHTLAASPDQGMRTVRSFGEDCLDRWETRDKLESMAALRSRWRRHVCAAPFVDWSLRDVGPGHLRRWLDRLERTLKPRTVRHCAFLVSGVFRDALERELVDQNPMTAVRKPVVRDSRVEIILTKEQVEALWAHALETKDPGAVMAVAYVGTGLRPGELLGLRLDEVMLDGEAPHLRVMRSGRRRRTTKTQQRRRVDLFGFGLDAVALWMREVRPALAIKRLDVAASPWAFPVPPAWLRARREVGQAIAAAGGEGLRAHDLRGTFASHALTGTWYEPWTLAEVAAHIGDSNETTQRHYAHLVGGAARRVVKGIPKGSAEARAAPNAPDESTKETDSSEQLALVAQLDRALASEARAIPSGRARLRANDPYRIRLLRAALIRAITERDPLTLHRALDLCDALDNATLAALEGHAGARRAGGAK